MSSTPTSQPGLSARRDPHDFRAVIFDMDGVIVDSEPYHERAFHEVVRDIGYERRFNMRFSDYVGLSDHVMWVEFVRRHKPPQTVEELLALKRGKIIQAMRDEQPIFEGLPELLEKLATRCLLGLASGSQHPVIEAVLGIKNLGRFFSAVVSSSDVPHGKPAPDIFLRTAELLGIPPCDCWVIEDSKPGVDAALNAGMRVIAITNTLPPEQLTAATHVVGDYAGIARLLLRR